MQQVVTANRIPALLVSLPPARLFVFRRYPGPRSARKLSALRDSVTYRWLCPADASHCVPSTQLHVPRTTTTTTTTRTSSTVSTLFRDCDERTQRML